MEEVKVRASTDPENLGGFLSNRVREGQRDLKLTFVGHVASETAEAGVRWANEWLWRDGIALEMGEQEQLEVVDPTGKKRDGMAVHLVVREGIPPRESQNDGLIRVRATTPPEKLGGFLAYRIRSGESPLKVHAVGTGAQDVVEDALKWCRTWLDRDGITIDVEQSQTEFQDPVGRTRGGKVTIITAHHVGVAEGAN